MEITGRISFTSSTYWLHVTFSGEFQLLKKCIAVHYTTFSYLLRFAFGTWRSCLCFVFTVCMSEFVWNFGILSIMNDCNENENLPEGGSVLHFFSNSIHGWPCNSYLPLVWCIVAVCWVSRALPTQLYEDKQNTNSAASIFMSDVTVLDREPQLPAPMRDFRLPHLFWGLMSSWKWCWVNGFAYSDLLTFNVRTFKYRTPLCCWNLNAL